VRLDLYADEDKPSDRDLMKERLSDINSEIAQLGSEIREAGGVLKEA